MHSHLTAVIRAGGILLLAASLLFPPKKCRALSSQEMEDWLEVFSAEEIEDFFGQQPQAALQIVQEEISSGPKYKYDYEHVIERVDMKATCSPPSDALPTIVAITNRESLVGCHSFHQHFNPKWRTVFVLNRDVAKNFGIDKMVENARCEDTLGATLLMLDNFGGEVLGRRVALDYTLKELPSDIEFLHQINCDVHPIPRRHKYHQSMEEIVTKMVTDFALIKQLVEYPSRDSIPIPSRFLEKPVLGMCAHLFEEFPSMNELVEEVSCWNDICSQTYLGTCKTKNTVLVFPLWFLPVSTLYLNFWHSKQLHGHDICSWRGVDKRPDDLRRYPWLCNNMDW